MRALAMILLATFIAGSVTAPVAANADSVDVTAPDEVAWTMSTHSLLSETGGVLLASVELVDESTTIAPTVYLINDAARQQIGPVTMDYDHTEGFHTLYTSRIDIPVGTPVGTWAVRLGPLSDEWGNTTQFAIPVDSLSVDTHTMTFAYGTPKIVGFAAVGSVMHVTTPETIGAPPSGTDYVWFRSGADTPIVGASTDSYQLTSDDLGHRIHASVIYKSGGGSTLIKNSIETFIVVRTPVVYISDQVGVGMTVGGSVSGAPHGATPQYQWFLDFSPIVGANQDTYVPTQAQSGHGLLLKVTYSEESSQGPNSLSVTSANSLIRNVVTVPSLKASGKIAVGHKVKVSAKGWGTSGVTARYHWYTRTAHRGKLVVVVTTRKPVLTIKKTWVGCRLTVSVTGSKPGWIGSSATYSFPKKITRK